MLLMAALGCAAFPALAQEHCLVGAQRAYDAMRLSDAIRLLEDCKSRG